MTVMTSVDLTARIPNNVGLADDPRLQRALEGWLPRYLDWWRNLGPVEHQDHEVFLRTATAVGQEGWAHFDHVRMPDYRWGIFLAEPEPDRRIAFGDRRGEPVWQEVPGEYRAELRRLVVVQGDTEPASVEQQRHLCRTAPSLYDMRNLLQVNVEEGRHLWAMVYLLHRYFGRDGRDEADELLERHSGDVDNPRILGAFNEPTPDWLSFYLFTYFTDRDGKFQLASLRESAFDPLSRTCDFMLKEEAHHMFVGATGVGRVVQRTVELMQEHDTDDVRPYGGLDVATLQRYLNFHYSVSLDLFGAETSTNAANYFAAGLKGRFQEERRDDHQLHDAVRPVPAVEAARITEREVPALSALNETLRDDYVADCAKGVDRWNRALADVGAELRLPHIGFHRAVGAFADVHVSPDGRIVPPEEWTASVGQWLPTEDDKAFVASLMQPVTERGKMAGWVAPPATGINGKPLDFDYVKLA
jgi:benzoyl-CoA 2,3-dioxygenase component B